jgi:putative NIF3 family GTP cyclohydrolase 1 type 2
MTTTFNPAEAEARLAVIAEYLPLAVDADPYTGRSDVYRPEKIATDGGPILADVPHDLAVFIAHAPTDLAEALVELRVLREMVAGRTVPPSDAEIEAHAKARGRWIYRAPGKYGFTQEVAVDAHVVATACTFYECTERGRWWATDRDGRICPWPVVTP